MRIPRLAAREVIPSIARDRDCPDGGARFPIPDSRFWMDPFSYLSVLISIILGLGITQLVTGLGRLIQARGRIKFYAPTIAWVGLLLIIHVQTWWAMFGLRSQV